MMTADKIHERLQLWAAQHRTMMAQLEALQTVTGADPDSPIRCMIDDLFQTYTVAVAELVGDWDEWLTWFAWENDMGKKRMSVSLPHGKCLPVSTLKQLAKIIAESQNTD